jgi:hypothetical protein
MFTFENTTSTAQIKFPIVCTYLFRQSRVIFWKIAGKLLNERSKEPVYGARSDPCLFGPAHRHSLLPKLADYFFIDDQLRIDTRPLTKPDGMLTVITRLPFTFDVDNFDGSVRRGMVERSVKPALAGLLIHAIAKKIFTINRLTQFASG